MQSASGVCKGHKLRLSAFLSRSETSRCYANRRGKRWVAEAENGVLDIRSEASNDESVALSGVRIHRKKLGSFPPHNNGPHPLHS